MELSSIIFWVFGMTWPEIEPRSSGPLAIILSANILGKSMVTRIQILDEFDCISHSTLGKCMNQNIQPPPIGK